MARARTYLALAILVGGIVFAAIRLWPSRAGVSGPTYTPEVQGEIDEAKARLAESASALQAQVERSDTARLSQLDDRVELGRELERSLRGMPGVNSDARLASVASDRLSLYALPDFDAYAEHVATLTGKDVRGFQAQREVFEKNSPALAGATFLWDQVEVRAHIHDPMEQLLTYGMNGTNTQAPGLYGKAPEKAEELARCRDIVVPLVMPWKDGESIALRLVISMQPGGSAGWTPFLVVLYDPEGQLQGRVPPWI